MTQPTPTVVFVRYVPAAVVVRSCAIVTALNHGCELIPDQSVLQLNIGDRIRLSAAQVERLSKVFFTEIESRFL